MPLSRITWFSFNVVVVVVAFSFFFCRMLFWIRRKCGCCLCHSLLIMISYPQEIMLNCDENVSNYNKCIARGTITSFIMFHFGSLTIFASRAMNEAQCFNSGFCFLLIFGKLAMVLSKALTGCFHEYQVILDKIIIIILYLYSAFSI